MTDINGGVRSDRSDGEDARSSGASGQDDRSQQFDVSSNFGRSVTPGVGRRSANARPIRRARPARLPALGRQDSGRCLRPIDGTRAARRRRHRGEGRALAKSSWPARSTANRRSESPRMLPNPCQGSRSSTISSASGRPSSQSRVQEASAIGSPPRLFPEKSWPCPNPSAGLCETCRVACGQISPGTSLTFARWCISRRVRWTSGASQIQTSPPYQNFSYVLGDADVWVSNISPHRSLLQPQ